MYMHLRLNEKSIEIPTASLEFERLWFATQQVMHLSDISYEEDGIQLADAPVQEGQYPKRDRPLGNVGGLIRIFHGFKGNTVGPSGTVHRKSFLRF